MREISRLKKAFLKPKKFVDINHVKNLNDFKLLQAGWIFDINFQPTLDCIKKRRYLELIQEVLPKTKEIKEIFDDLDQPFILRYFYYI